MFGDTLDVTSLETFGTADEGHDMVKKKKQAADDITKEILAGLSDSLRKVKSTAPKKTDESKLAVEDPSSATVTSDVIKITGSNAGAEQALIETPDKDNTTPQETSIMNTATEVIPTAMDVNVEEMIADSSETADTETAENDNGLSEVQSTVSPTAQESSTGPVTHRKTKRRSSESTTSQGSPRSLRSQGSPRSLRSQGSPRSLRSKGRSSLCSSRRTSAEESRFTTDDDSDDDSKLTIDMEVVPKSDISPPVTRKRGRPRKSVTVAQDEPKSDQPDVDIPAKRTRSKQDTTQDSGSTTSVTTRSGRQTRFSTAADDTIPATTRRQSMRHVQGAIVMPTAPQTHRTTRTSSRAASMKEEQPEVMVSDEPTTTLTSTVDPVSLEVPANVTSVVPTPSSPDMTVTPREPASPTPASPIKSPSTEGSASPKSHGLTGSGPKCIPLSKETTEETPLPGEEVTIKPPPTPSLNLAPAEKVIKKKAMEPKTKASPLDAIFQAQDKLHQMGRQPVVSKMEGAEKQESRSQAPVPGVWTMPAHSIPVGAKTGNNLSITIPF